MQHPTANCFYFACSWCSPLPRGETTPPITCSSCDRRFFLRSGSPHWRNSRPIRWAQSGCVPQTIVKRLPTLPIRHGHGTIPFPTVDRSTAKPLQSEESRNCRCCHPNSSFSRQFPPDTMADEYQMSLLQQKRRRLCAGVHDAYSGSRRNMLTMFFQKLGPFFGGSKAASRCRTNCPCRTVKGAMERSELIGHFADKVQNRKISSIASGLS